MLNKINIGSDEEITHLEEIIKKIKVRFIIFIKDLTHFQETVLEGLNNYDVFLSKLDKSLRYIAEQIQDGDKYSLKKVEEEHEFIKNKKQYFEEKFLIELESYEQLFIKEMEIMFTCITQHHLSKIEKVI